MKVVVLAGGYDQIRLITGLKEHGVEVILIDYYQNPPAKSFADKHYRISTLDYESCKNIVIEESASFITTACTDQALLTAALVSEQLNIPFYLSYQTALNLTNKSLMKDIMIKHGIPTSRFAVVTDVKDINLCNMNFPLVVKPSDCNSSKGVKKVSCFDELSFAVEEALILSRTNKAIVEEFVSGVELSVDAYVRDGVCKLLLVTETRKTKNSTGFTINQSIYPATIPPSAVSEIEDILNKICEVYKLVTCPLLLQAIYTEGHINVIEFSARMGGGTKYELIKKVTNVDIMQVYIDEFFKESDSVFPEQIINFAHLNYCYCLNGTIKEFRNFEQLKERAVIEDYFFYKTIGDSIQKAENSSDRAAGYLILSDTIDDLTNKENIAQSEIAIISEAGEDIFIRNQIVT